MAKLDTTSEVVITMSFIVMNLEKILAGIVSYALFLCRLLPSNWKKPESEASKAVA